MSKLPDRFSFIKPEKSPLFYGYVIAAVGTLGVIASIPGQTIGVSTFTDPVKDALGLNRDQFSNAYMIGTILSSLVLGKAGQWFDKYGARWLSLFATLGLAISLGLCASSALISSGIKSIMGTETWLVPFFLMIGLFFLLRFTGQGVLTMSSRNMIMKWFDHYRGRVNAIRTIAVSLGFSASPLWISMLIDQNGWQKTWIYLALGLLVMAVIILQFYRDNPEDHGLVPDGELQGKKNEAKPKPVEKQFTLKEALATRAFWSYALTISFNSFFITGLTFHVVSVFETASYSKDEAVAIFLPMSVISVALSLVGNVLADFIKLHYFLFIMLFGGIMASVGLILLAHPMGVYILVAGLGIMGGMFAVLNAITWPRYYGRKHLGAITGRLMSMLVFASALAPSLFSFSKTYFNSYQAVAVVSLAFLVFVTLGAFKVRNPQDQLEL